MLLHFFFVLFSVGVYVRLLLSHFCFLCPTASFFLISTVDLFKAIKNNVAPGKEINEKRGILKNELQNKKFEKKNPNEKVKGEWAKEQKKGYCFDLFCYCQFFFWFIHINLCRCICECLSYCVLGNTTTKAQSFVK